MVFIRNITFWVFCHCWKFTIKTWSKNNRDNPYNPNNSICCSKPFMTPLTLFHLIYAFQTQAIQEQIVQPRLPVNQERQLSIPELIKQEGELAGLANAEIKKLTSIAFCESRFDEKAQNPTSSASGIYQIIFSTWLANSDYPWEDRYKAKENIRTAIKIYLRSGFGQWVCQ